MKTKQPTSTLAASFSPVEWRTLRALRLSYQQGRDLWSAPELAHLRFLRWLYHTGRLVP